MGNGSEKQGEGGREEWGGVEGGEAWNELQGKGGPKQIHLESGDPKKTKQKSP